MQSEDSVEEKRKMCSGELSLSALTYCLVTDRDTAWELGETPCLHKFRQVAKQKNYFLVFSHCSSYSLSLLVFIHPTAIVIVCGCCVYSDCISIRCYHSLSLSLNSYSVDLVVCSALGVDMYDCVFPTRTAVGCPPSLTGYN